MDWRERLRIDSEACLMGLVAADPDFSLDEEQPSYRGGTHYVTFGSYQGKPAAFKFFVAPRRWDNEAACLAHFRGTGLVPEIFHQMPGSLIVMERLRGADVLDALSERTLGPGARNALSQTVGAAFGRLATIGPPESTEAYNPMTDFPDWGWNLGLPNVVERCSREGRKLVEAAVPHDAQVLASSLARIEERLAAVESEPRILFHEDVSNLRVEGTRFVAFYDLELCRGGTASMQLGACMNLCRENGLDWNHLVEGFQEGAALRLTQDDFRSILGMNHLLRWIRVRLEDDATPAEAKSLAGELVATERMARPGL